MSEATFSVERFRRPDTPPEASTQPTQLRMLDTRAPGFDEECARQVRLVNASETPESMSEMDEWVEASDKFGWTAGRLRRADLIEVALQDVRPK